MPWTYHGQSNNLVSLHDLLPAVLLRQAIQQLLYRLVVDGLEGVPVEPKLLVLRAQPERNGQKILDNKIT